MATVWNALQRAYHVVHYEWADPRTTQWPFTGNWLWPVGIVTLYVWIVKYKGPELMANRKAFDLKWVLVAYNVLQVLINGYLFYRVMKVVWLSGYYSIRCQPVDYSRSEKALEVAWGVYLYYLVKLLDLLDTVFYVLRKRNRQISFLNVYHHAGMVCIGYAGVCYLPGGHCIFLGTVNLFVHVIMYSYYLSTVLRPTYLDSGWWKKHLTQLQMVQFLLILLHVLQLLWEDCGYPRFAIYILVPQIGFMLILFADFYRHTYLRKPRKKGNGYAEKAVNGYAGKAVNGYSEKTVNVYAGMATNGYAEKRVGGYTGDHEKTKQDEEKAASPADTEEHSQRPKED